jgi:leucyl aminopeptidase
MKISFSKLTKPAGGSVVLFVAQGGQWSKHGEALDRATGGQLTKAAKSSDFSGKRKQTLTVLAPHGTGLDRIVAVGLGDRKELAALEAEKLGGRLAAKLTGAVDGKAQILVESFAGIKLNSNEFAAHLATGAKLRAYKFDKYKSGNDNDKDRLTELVFRTRDPAAAKRTFAPLEAVATGVCLARDLVNEPPNELYPVTFARRIRQLTKLGLKVEVMGKKRLEQEKFHALLGVGQGSARESQVAVMRWMGGKKSQKPAVFVGKGVTFDTGGISLKPGAGMGDMKGDMGGAACVTGLMAALAGRKAKVNAIGLVGLVENMPDAAAQRPGDVVKSLSGKTIEILNTDAEGRLVLADALWYAQKKFKPDFMIDLATLTGAIMVALGQEHAGLFSNSDDLCAQLDIAAEATGEKVWRMPLAKAYDKMIDSKVADVKNIGGRFAGSITAAQFLQRFVNDVPWAHLDIAGTAMNSPKSDINTSWGSGYGVRLLDRLVADRYE